MLPLFSNLTNPWFPSINRITKMFSTSLSIQNFWSLPLRYLLKRFWTLHLTNPGSAPSSPNLVQIMRIDANLFLWQRYYQEAIFSYTLVIAFLLMIHNKYIHTTRSINARSIMSLVEFHRVFTSATSSKAFWLIASHWRASFSRLCGDARIFTTNFRSYNK